MAELYTDVNKITANLQLKAEKDLSNVGEVSQQFKEHAVSWGVPDYSAGVDLSYTTTNTNFPSNGIAYFGYKAASNTSAFVYIDDQQFGIGGSSAGNISTQTAYIVSKNNVYRYQTASAGQYGIFYPFKGVN